jgi:hypothetical protein
MRIAKTMIPVTIIPERRGMLNKRDRQWRRRGMQGVVDGRERDAHVRAHRILVQHLRVDMSIAAAKQQFGKGDALARRPQASP